MKCLYKIIVISCFIPALFARDIILVENKASAEEGKLLMKILQEKFNVPKKLISYREPKEECAHTSEAIMQLCLKENGELEIVRLNKLVMQRAFGVFSETGE